MQYLILLLGFAVLLKGADLFVTGATFLARKLKVSDLFIGLTVVAFGTSMPELMVNIHAASRGISDIAMTNILGSNTFNILVILGIAGLIYPLTVKRNTVRFEIPICFLSVAFLGILVINPAGYFVLSRIDGVVLILGFCLFLYYVLRSLQKENTPAFQSDCVFKKMFFFIILGFLGLFIGARIVVDSSVKIAACLGVSTSLIGVTVVAAGTSLPELATSAVAAFRKNADIAVGNIVGSNIFNILFILGISSLIRPLKIQYPMFGLDIAATIISSLLLFVFMFTGNRMKLDRWEAVFFLLVYFVFIFFRVLK